MKTYSMLRLALELIRALRALVGLVRAIVQLLSMAINYFPGSTIGKMDTQIRD